MATKSRKLFGPGFLITAAFIGPGTIATASSAGSGFGYALLWAVAFSVVATMVLQEMTARLGVVTGCGLGQSLRDTFRAGWGRVGVIALSTFAILFGNSAFQAGNITGAAQGLGDIFGGVPLKVWMAVIAVLAWGLLMTGKFKLIQNVLMVLVIGMSGIFVLSAVAVSPDWSEVFKGALLPSFPAGSLLTVIALVGTTVVPYNLFLHSNSAADFWAGEEDKPSALRRARIDAFVSIFVGGMVTGAIVISAAVALGGAGQTMVISEIAKQLEPVMGGASKWVFGFGLLAAGLTSAITAPLAAAYATCGCMGWGTKIFEFRFRLIFSLVILVGLVACLVFPGGKSPAQLIILAQFANGLLLPVLTFFLLVVMNNRRLLGRHSNGITANVLGGATCLLTAFWGINQLVKAVQGVLNLYG